MRRRPHADTVAMATEAYAKHELLESQTNGSVHSWAIGRPGSSIYYARIISTPSTLIITGDGPDLIVYGGGGITPLSRAHWFATSSLDYLVTKLRSAPHGGVYKLGLEWDAELAATEVRQLILEAKADLKRLKEEGAQDPDFDLDTDPDVYAAYAQVDMWTGLDSDIRIGMSYAEFAALSYQHTSDPEYSFGVHIASYMYYAQAACHRLVEMLGAKADHDRKLTVNMDDEGVTGDLIIDDGQTGMLHLGRRAMCGVWRWVDGMVGVMPSTGEIVRVLDDGAVLVSRGVYTGPGALGALKHTVPDVHHPATKGCMRGLLAEANEVWLSMPHPAAEPTPHPAPLPILPLRVALEQGAGAVLLRQQPHWGGGVVVGCFHSEGEALVVALEQISALIGASDA